MKWQNESYFAELVDKEPSTVLKIIRFDLAGMYNSILVSVEMLLEDAKSKFNDEERRDLLTIIRNSTIDIHEIMLAVGAYIEQRGIEE